ncbi:ATP-dependent DNA helicase [Corynebacterium gerontici]|nr:ATP-dependent DNA helicase [Corynebacterium gerontici]
MAKALERETNPSPALSLRSQASAAFRVPENPKISLRPSGFSAPLIEHDLPLFSQTKGRWRIRAHAGAGLSTVLMDFVAHQLAQGVPANEILVVAASKEAAARLRAGIADRLAGVDDADFVADNTMVRSVHSLAFALLRQCTSADIRLITGAEQDGVIRDLLQGQLDAGPAALAMWPEQYRDAIGFVGFARSLRDFLLRAAERGASPDELRELGRREHIPMWSAAGDFLEEYEQVMSLGSPHNYSASELVSRVLEHPIEDQGWRIVVVDDAQHFDPKSAQLVETIMQHADTAIIAGDPEQHVLSFRGASVAWLENAKVDHDLYLDHVYRQPKAQKMLASSGAREHLAIANIVRRAHLIDGQSWKDIAVIVRSSQQVASLRRALLAAGVPAAVDATDVVLSEQHIVSSMLLALKALDRPLPLPDVEALVLGPIGGADAITMRRLLRALRRAELAQGGTRRALEILGKLIRPSEEAEQIFDEALAKLLGPREQGILERIRGVLSAGAKAEGVEGTLWSVWEATGLSEHLAAQSLRGGATGAQADRDLDAMLALFDAAGDWVERRPNGSVQGFIRHIEEQMLPTGVRDRRIEDPDVVQVLTAHGAAAKEWKTVIVAGVQESIWPALDAGDTAFRQAAFVDLLDRDIDPNLPTSRLKEQLDEEHRLFHLACTRATEQLLITAVEDPEDPHGQPSQFFEGYEAPLFRAEGDAAEPETAASLGDGTRLLSVAALVAELRRVLSDETAPQRRKEQAARQLARLANAGVPGAHPGQWWGIGAETSKSALPVQSISPSKVESALRCPLNAQLGNLAGDSSAMSIGTLVHAYAEAISTGAPVNEARTLITEAVEAMQHAPSWAIPGIMADFGETLDRLEQWLSVHNAGDTLLGVEVPVDVTLPNGVRIRGKIDRLEQAGEAINIVDLKLTKQAYAKAKVEELPQMVAYQLALRHGEFRDGEIRTASGDAGIEVEGAVLVFPKQGTKGATTREQSKKTDEVLDHMAAQLPLVLEELRGPSLRATANEMCKNCSLISVCPAQERGRMTNQ